MALGRFQKGQKVYTCQSCKKQTRNVGGDEFYAGLCADCYELAGIDNSLTDNGPEEMSGKLTAQHIFERRPELIPVFKALSDVVLKKEI
jgi:hypothetical protein